MARKQQPNKQNGKGRLRVFFAEFEGDDETIQEGLRAISTAVGKTFQPKVIALSPPTPNRELGHQDIDENVIDAETAVVEDELPLFDNTPQEQEAVPRPKRKLPTMSIVKDLDLRPDGKISLRDFYAKKNPSSQEKKIAVFVYYLQHTLEIEGITPNHVFSCFKDVGARPPRDLPQIIRNTATKRAWVDSSDAKSIKITNHGENLVEHDLESHGEA